MKIRSAAGWVWPALTLAALPKCPACLAAYLAVSTGVTITLPTATYSRVFIVMVCVAALLRLAAKRLRQLTSSKTRTTDCLCQWVPSRSAQTAR